MSINEKFLLGALIYNAAWMIELDETLKIIPAFLMTICWVAFILADSKKDLTTPEKQNGK